MTSIEIKCKDSVQADLLFFKLNKIFEGKVGSKVAQAVTVRVEDDAVSINIGSGPIGTAIFTQLKGTSVAN